ncbi:hypothetical protein INT45_010850 [Circinella minor]|uniref:Chitin-binding type-2 domain-containing protein n=1 Tax=Circinella minor TaxID=1195481 RepID=A0A8H7VJ90_9FUNG|nr:hypothetical protein INT45_010850 [Circinella minor]
MHLITVATTTLLTLSFVSAIPNFFTRRGAASNDDTSKESIPVDKCPSLPLWGPSYAPVPGSCTKYYRCAIITGQPIIFECPVPLQFNPITGRCDIFQNVRCKNGKYPTDYEYGDKSKKPADDNSGHSGDRDKRQVEENGDIGVDSTDQQITDDTTNGDGDGDEQTVLDNTQNSGTQSNNNVDSNSMTIDNINTGQNQSYAITEPTDAASDINTNNTQEVLFSDDFDSTYENDNKDDSKEEFSNSFSRGGYNFYKREDIKEKDNKEDDAREDNGYGGGDDASDVISDDKDELSSGDGKNYVEDNNDKEEESDYETGNDYGEEEIIDSDIDSSYVEQQSNDGYKEESSDDGTENDYDEQKIIGDDEEYSSIDNYNTTKNQA